MDPQSQTCQDTGFGVYPDRRHSETICRYLPTVSVTVSVSLSP